MKKNQRMFWNEYYRLHGSAWRKTNFFEQSFENQSVLELGCGNGKSLLGLIEKKPLRIVAVDFSEIALRIAKQKIPKGVEFFRADCVNLPFKQKEFDVVIANHVIGAILEGEREQAVSEIFRVLKETGTTLFSDFAVGDLREKGTIIEKNTYQKKNGIIQHFFTEPETKSLFSKFSSKKIKTISNYLLLGKKRVLRSEIFGEFKK
jgi:ubiquinone/menaquinone biosynthesis C-methylase UbiE